jgi:type II secretory pathway component PulJ
VRRGNGGAVLLEVMVALALLVVSAVPVVSLLSAALRSEMALAEREATMREADRMLASLALLTRTDLDRRLGRHPARTMVADVTRPAPTLYRLALRESDTAAVELLVTVVHRPDRERP